MAFNFSSVSSESSGLDMTSYLSSVVECSDLISWSFMFTEKLAGSCCRLVLTGIYVPPFTDCSNKHPDGNLPPSAQRQI